MSEIILIAEQYRNQNLSTNLYSPENIYKLDGEKANRIISTIGETLLGGSFDFSNSIIGRLILPNTPIQQIGNRELAKALAKRVSGQLIQNVIGSFDFRKGSINKPNFWSITNLPILEDNTINFNNLLNTLFGYQSLNDNLNGDYSNENLYRTLGAGSKNQFDNSTQNNIFTINSDTYTNDLSEISRLNDGSGILSESKPINIFNTYSLNSSLENSYPSKSTVASDLNIIGNQMDYDALAYNTKHENNDGYWVYNPSGNNSNIVSKGSNVLNDNNRFCRTWNIFKRYSSYKDLVKFDNNKNIDLKLNTVQGKSILPNIHPDRDSVKKYGYVKNLMFSLENLAYADDSLRLTLKPQEKGKLGKIMWFPPYNLNITEVDSPKISSIEVLGRNEPLYTYNGVERNINLSFTLIVDAPSYVRNFNDSNNEYSRLFAGCKTIVNNSKKGLSDNEKNSLEVKKLEYSQPDKPIKISLSPNPFPKNSGAKFYFSNDKYDYTSDINGPKEDDEAETGKKGNIEFMNKIGQLVSFMLTDEGRDNYKIVFRGFASKLNDAPYNKVLGYLRAFSIYDLVSKSLKTNDSTQTYTDNILNFTPQINPKTGSVVVPKDRVSINKYDNKRVRLETYGEDKAKNVNSSKYTLNEDIIDRYCEVYLEQTVSNIKKTDAPDKVLNNIKKAEIDNIQGILNNSNINSDYSEEFYFDKLEKNDPLIFNQYKEKVRYFSPVFHSQTPEDFNSRLVFLKQCVRQGESQSRDVQNSIFGKPPVCILRLGDFFHSRVMINSITKTYEPLIWDMNPEGIGIQPMICNVTLDMYVIGGQSLDGPYNKLLNALDSNFYANAEMYDSKAFSISKSYVKDVNEAVKNIVNNSDNKPTSISKDQIERSEISNTSVQSSQLNVGANTGTNKIKYNDILFYKTSILKDWLLYLDSLDDKYKKYLVNGILSVNSYLEDTGLSEDTNAIKINGELRNISNKYNSYNIENISFTGVDNNKVLIQNSDYVNFTNLVNELSEFKENNIFNYTDSNQLNSLIKLEKNIKNLNELTYE